MGSRAKTDFLVASPSFLTGTARLMDWCGLFDDYNSSPNGAVADSSAIASDWAVVGDDLWDAIGQFET